MGESAFAEDCTDTKGRIESLVEEALASETNEMQRDRFRGGIAEVRVREAPLFGIRVEVDLRFEAAKCGEIVPGEIENSVVEDEMAQLIDVTDDVTRLREAVSESTYDQFVEEIAAGKDCNPSAVRETLDEMALCSHLFATEERCVATFFAYV